MNSPANAGRRVVVFGGSAAQPGDAEFDAAERLGAAIAARGWTVVNGGYGGTMLASACAARRAGGHTIGVTCSIFKSASNDFIAEVIRTDNLHDRLRRLIDLGDAYVTLPGSTGTLAELALVWELVNKRMIPARPIICLGPFWRAVVGIFARDETRDARLPAPPPAPRMGDLITFVDSPTEAVEAIAAAFR